MSGSEAATCGSVADLFRLLSSDQSPFEKCTSCFQCSQNIAHSGVICSNLRQRMGVQGGSFSLSLPLCSITCSKYETTVASHPSLKPHRSWTLFFFSPSVQLVRQASVVFLSLCKYQGWSLRAAVYEDDVGVMCVECGGWRVKEEEEEWR